MRADELIIYSDMDGTCLADWELGDYVPEQNLEAIKRFTQAGGLFSVASGRNYADILAHFPKGCINAPLICANGALIYDANDARIIQRFLLSAEYKRECVDYCAGRPELCISAADDRHVYRVNTGDGRHGTSTRTAGIISPGDFICGDYIKMAFRIPRPELMDALELDVGRFASASEVSISRSADIYLDVVDAAANKANGISAAMRATGTKRTLVCIGDYFNDMQMLAYASISACPITSHSEIKKLCKVVTCGNNEGAIADLIKILCSET